LAHREQERGAEDELPGAPDRVDPAERLQLAGLTDRELHVLLDYASGVSLEVIADRLNERSGTPADRSTAVQPHEVAGFIDRIGDRRTREFRTTAVLGGREPAGRGVRTEAAERWVATAEQVALRLLAEALGLGIDDARELVRDEVLAEAAGMTVERLRDRIRDQVVLFGLDRQGLEELWESVPDEVLAQFVGLTAEQLSQMVHDRLTALGSDSDVTRETVRDEVLVEAARARIDDDAVRARFGLGDLQRLVRDELLAAAATLTAEDVWETFSDADLAGAVGMGLRQLDRRVRERIIARVEAEVGPDVLRQAVDELLRDQGARDGLWR